VSRYLPDDEAAKAYFRVSAVQMFTMKDTMFVNTDTVLALQIMQAESHPHLHNQGPTKSNGGSKEGLSFFGLFQHFARTPQGKFLLRQYFLRPSTNPAVLSERLDAVSVLVRPENDATVHDLSKNLAQVKNIRVSMINLRKGVSSAAGNGKGVARGVWATLRLFVYRALRITDAMQQLIGAESLAIHTKILHQFEGRRLATIGRSVCNIIDFETSELEHRTCVKPGVDEELDNMRHLYAGLEDLLGSCARSISRQIPLDTAGSLNVVFFPQIGFLVSIPRDPGIDEVTVAGLVRDQGWERIFHTQ
jgi:DNA mismatch repair protein MSH5